MLWQTDAFISQDENNLQFYWLGNPWSDATQECTSVFCLISPLLTFCVLIGFEAREYIAALGVLLWGLEHRSVSESTRDGSRRSEQTLGLLASRWGNALHRMTWLSLVFTNMNAYARCGGEEFCSNPATNNEELVLATDVTVRRWCVVGTSHLLGDFSNNFNGQWTCFAT